MLLPWLAPAGPRPPQVPVRLDSQQGWLRRRAPTATLRLAALLNLGNLYSNASLDPARFH